MSADFEAFTKESGKVQDTINHYNIEWNPDLTDPCEGGDDECLRLCHVVQLR